MIKSNNYHQEPNGHSMKQEIMHETAKASPALGLAAWQYLLNMPVEKWVSVATLVYVALQAFFLVKDRTKRRGK